MAAGPRRFFPYLSLLKNCHRNGTSAFTTSRCNMSNNTTEKAMGEGTVCPPLPPDTLRLYSMRFCPFVQRTRLVLAHKNIPHEVVNIHLTDKPSWFLEKAPLGLVPVLEYNDDIVYGSEICDDYLDQIYPQNKLNADDPLMFAKERMHREPFSQVTSNSYRFRKIRSEEDAATFLEKLQGNLKYYEMLLEKNSGAFLTGSEVTMLDYHLWPWFERFPVVSKFLDEDVLAPFPRLQAWVLRMSATPAVMATKLSNELHAQYLMSLAEGKPKFDIGLEAHAKL